MEIFTIGFTQKTAERFFETLKTHRIRQLMDIRLNNVSQLAGFTKKDDLAYFLRELCGADYVHEIRLAPTDDLLGAYKAGRTSWSDYETAFLSLMKERRIEEAIPRSAFDTPTVLLCSESAATMCHRRLVGEYLAAVWHGVRVTHL